MERELVVLRRTECNNTMLPYRSNGITDERKLL
jgi:hypothetical protein